MASRLKFPDDWLGIAVQINHDGAYWRAFRDTKYIYLAINGTDSDCVRFGGSTRFYYSWNEVLEDLYGKENENRQFCAMVDLITWELQGPGIGGPLSPQIELFND